MKWLSEWLERITMYRLLLYYLIALLGVAAALSVLGILRISAVAVVFTPVFLTAVCWLSNKLFSYVFEAPTNVESVYITALILALIITPTTNAQGLLFLTAAGGLAVASKYLLAINRRHVFNPVAIAVMLTSFGAGDSPSWWVGTAAMLPFVLAGGILVVYKTRRLGMVLTFVGAALLSTTFFAAIGQADVLGTLQKAVLNSAIFFTAFVMLTEPLTSPTTKIKQKWYSAIVGALFPPQVNIFGVFSTPELALVIGNIYSYIAGPRVKVFASLAGHIGLSDNTTDFVFTPDHTFTYLPGQYMEVTLQHAKTDSRGARRYFTLASSPTENNLRLGIKFYKKGSSYKRALLGMKKGGKIVAAQLGGDFVLPKNSGQKIALIAGGIGITPYRSMLKYLLDTKQTRPITVLYAAKTDADVVYRDVLEAARTQLGVQTTYVTGAGRITAELIAREVPDFNERLFYISGPHSMVVAVAAMLRQLGVPRRHIKKDFFSGYA